jgi:hypothetical protein
MKLLAELKRRNVIRMALAYAVVAWFIVQAADVLLGNFGAPSSNANPLLDVLASNGGPTPTMQPQGGSPAIDGA